MIRVLHSVSNMDRAGIETMIMNYYRHMDDSVVQFDFWANKPKPGAYEPEIARRGGRVYRSCGFNPLRFSKYVRGMKEAVKNDKDMAMVHVHNGALGLYALCAARRLGIPSRIYHAHSTRVPTGKAKPFKMLLKPFIKHAANHYLGCSEKSARFYYGARNVRRGKCVIIRNAIEASQFLYNERTRLRIRAENALSGFVVGHVGRFTDAKNHLRLLEIFKALCALIPDATLVLLGDGELEGSVREKVSTLKLDENVRFMGNVPNVNEWYQAFDLFLMPSIWEGLPVVAIEAQAACLPCVLSDVITKEVRISDLLTFLSLDKSNEEWAEALYKLLKTPSPRVDMLKTVQDAGYDVTIEAKKLQDLYCTWAEEVR